MRARTALVVALAAASCGGEEAAVPDQAVVVDAAGCLAEARAEPCGDTVDAALTGGATVCLLVKDRTLTLRYDAGGDRLVLVPEASGPLDIEVRAGELVALELALLRPGRTTCPDLSAGGPGGGCGAHADCLLSFGRHQAEAADAARVELVYGGADGAGCRPQCADACGAETCNGADDDCDGEVDEGFEEVPEVCNGLDDDCDGQTDEGLDLGAPCAVGRGVCRREGIRACDAGGTGEVGCDAAAGEPDPAGERCNGLDDDCDGQADEAPMGDVGQPCHEGVGGCRREAVLTCVGGAPACPVEAGGPDPAGESCNGVDDDCDGQTDEGRVAGVGEPCTAGAGQCARAGLVVCLGQPDVGLSCDAVPGDPAPEELCDGLDNTCSGVVDAGCDDDGDGWCDDALSVPDPDAPGLLCRPGDCDDTPETGEEVSPGRPELDNGVDDDCDGVPDDGFAALAFGGPWRVEIPGDEALSLDEGDFTIEAWVRLSGFPRSGAAPVLSRRASNLVDDGYMLGFTGDIAAGGRRKCSPFFMAGDGAEETWVVGNDGNGNACDFGQLGRWIHLAATLERREAGVQRVRVFRDGAEVARHDAFPARLPRAEQAAWVGADSMNGAYVLSGDVSDVRISRGLLYPGDPAPACLPAGDATLAHWPLMEGSGAVAYDAGPLGLHGAILPANEAADRWLETEACGGRPF